MRRGATTFATSPRPLCDLALRPSWEMFGLSSSRSSGGSGGSMPARAASAGSAPMSTLAKCTSANSAGLGGKKGGGFGDSRAGPQR